jgi:hypothetical protein
VALENDMTLFTPAAAVVVLGLLVYQHLALLLVLAVLVLQVQ